MYGNTTTGTTTAVIVSGAVLLLVGWGFAVALLVLGSVRQSRPIFGWGLVVAGLMTLISPLAVYLNNAIQYGITSMGPTDLLVLSSLSCLGGAVVSLGFRYVATPSASPGAFRGS